MRNIGDALIYSSHAFFIIRAFATLNALRPVDVAAIVGGMRQNRHWMVEVPEQWAYIHRVIERELELRSAKMK